jgi:hypothetical protein
MAGPLRAAAASCCYQLLLLSARAAGAIKVLAVGMVQSAVIVAALNNALEGPTGTAWA